MSPGILRQARASACVSVSAKKSATRGSNPASTAARANARPEIAAIRSEPGPLGDERLGKSVGGTEIEIDRLLGSDHLLEQARLGLVLHVADGERADTDRVHALD